MRIDSLSNAMTEMKTNIADLLTRLDTGDFLNAKVLEMASNEILLRLFDGSVLKAAAEGLDAKVGQNLTLKVTSKAEGVLFLETVKDPFQGSNIKPDILKNMLEALNIKPDNKNMALAAEFIKVGVSPTTTQMDTASALMKSFKGLDAEKAVFIVSKELQPDVVNLELLAKLLDGNIKLGEQLKEIQTSLHINILNILNNEGSDDSDLFLKLNALIKDLFVNISSDKLALALASELDINNLQNNLKNKLMTLKADIQAANLKGVPGTGALLSSATQIEDGAKLMNQLNNGNMCYYQLPINLSGHTTTAELYIMKNKRSKKGIDPYNTVMYVALDTKNLGRIETLLDIKGNNVSINLRTVNQNINRFVKENIKHLYSGLSACGYKLTDVKYSLLEAATPPVKLEQLLTKMIETNHSKVDMRI